MKRLNCPAGAVMAVVAAAGMTATGAFAASPWGPSGEASYEEHQAQPVSLYTRAQVQDAYRQAVAQGTLPRTAEVVAESPAQLAWYGETAMPQDQAAQVAQTEPAPSYSNPADSAVLAQSSRAGDPGWPAPQMPADAAQGTPDMMGNDGELALSEGEELVAAGGTPDTQPLQ